jgi:aspartyl-tRNA(Asn)/glutamyl-tRNA(Gln) amidotransferase subunit C
MNISREDVLRVAELANLELTEAEIATYGAQLASILSYCEKLNELDTTTVEPMAQILEVGGLQLEVGAGREPAKEPADASEAQHARKDTPRDAAIISEVVRRAPGAVASPTPYFRVPKVIER